jgi:hypothetical protein
VGERGPCARPAAKSRPPQSVPLNCHAWEPSNWRSRRRSAPHVRGTRNRRLVREAVRHRDVVQRGLDVLHQLPLVLHRLHRPLATPRPPRLHAAQAPSAAPRRPSSASPGYRAVSRTRSSRWSRPSSISTRDGRVERTELQGRRSTLAKMDPKESSKESAASNSGRNLQPFDQQANAHKNSNQS